MSIQEKQREIIEDLNLMPTPDDKFEYIIQLGKDLPGLPDDKKDEQHLVKGCVSQVWLHADLDGDTVQYQADSDAMIVRGLVSILLNVFSGEKPDDILAADTQFLEEAGFSNLISVNRRNGLYSMLEQIKYYALAYQNVLKAQQG